MEPITRPKTELGESLKSNVSQDANLDSPSSSAYRLTAFRSFQKQISLAKWKQIEISTLKISNEFLSLASFGSSFTASDNLKLFKMKWSYSIASLLVDVFPR